MSRLQRLEGFVHQKRAELDAARSEGDSAREKLSAAISSRKAWEEAQVLIQQAAETVQTMIHSQIEDVVTRCVQEVYGDEITFHVEFSRKRGKTEARLFFKKDGYEYDPVEASSLGVVDVASLGLRLAILKLHNPAVAQVLIMDEPMKWVDKEARPRVAVLIDALARELQVQIIMVTHFDEFKLGKVIRV